MHDYWPFYITLAAILAGILFNHQDLNRLEDRIGKRFDSMEKRFDRIEARVDRIEADLREFYRAWGDHGARIENLEKRVK